MSETICRAVVCTLTLVFTANAFAQLSWSAPTPVNTDYSVDERWDANLRGGPQLAGDGKGNWVAVWDAEPDAGSALTPFGTDYDLFVSTSSDNGRTWSALAPLNTNAAVDNLDDASPSIATDRKGNWVVVWWSGDNAKGSVQRILSAISSDNGATWSTPSLPLTTDARQGVKLVTNGRGTWIAAWATLTGAIKYSRSIDNGVSWSPDEDISSNAQSNNDTLSLATDGGGNWICAFESFDDAHQENGLGWDIFYNVSTDDGDTWGNTSILNSNSDASGVDDNEPEIVTDGRGTWICIWHSDPPDTKGLASAVDSEILFARSTDTGFSWTDAASLNTDAAMDTNADAFASVATDGFGNIVAVWEDLSALVLDSAVSRDNGQTWSDTLTVHDEFNGRPRIVTDENGNWLTIWTSFVNPDEPLQSDADVYVAEADFTATLTGIVVDADSDVALSCATVRIVPAAGGLERVVSTDLNGVYRALNLPEGAYTLEVYSPAHATAIIDNVAVSGTSTFRAVSLDPILQTSGVAGRVTDMATMEPLYGVRVEARINNLLVASTYTCSDGNYAIWNLVDGKAMADVQLDFSAENFDDETRNVMVETGLTTEVDVAMEKSVAAPGSLAGVVLSEDGNTPLANARVAVGGQANLSADTDNDGVYLFDALPEGRYTVEASAEGHIGAIAVKSVSAFNVESQDFILTPGQDGVLAGDVNGDNEVNAVDIQLVINQALGLPGEGDADLNDDGTVNAIDVQLIINIVLGVA